MKIFKIKRINRRIKIYILGVRIFSYKTKENVKEHFLEIQKQIQCLNAKVQMLSAQINITNQMDKDLNSKVQIEIKKIQNTLHNIQEYNKKILQADCFIWEYMTGLEFCNYKTLKHEREISFSPEMYARDHYYRYEFSKKYCEQGFKVLDIACGTGCGSYMISQTGAFVEGVDLSKEAIEFANKVFLPKATNLNFIQGNALEFRKDKKYDLITSFETIEHIPHTEALLKNFYCHLRDNGRLICSVPNETISPHKLSNNPYHLKHYTTEELASLLRQAGFLIEKVCYQYDYGKVDEIRDNGQEGETIIFVSKKGKE